jgi:hypothetical protein
MAETEAPKEVIPSPYEQMKGETEKAFNAFLVYRDLSGTATMKRAWEESRVGEKRVKSGGKKAPGYFEEWARDYKWAPRRALYQKDMRLLRMKEAAENCITIGTNIAKVCNEVLGQVQAVSAKLDTAGITTESLRGQEIQKLGTISKSIAALTTAATNGMKLVGDGLNVGDMAENSELEELLAEVLEDAGG